MPLQKRLYKLFVATLGVCVDKLSLYMDKILALHPQLRFRRVRSAGGSGILERLNQVADSHKVCVYISWNWYVYCKDSFQSLMLYSSDDWLLGSFSTGESRCLGSQYIDIGKEEILSESSVER
ncbi:hypothetical protein J6590_046482 [Homalodisca vitripennis]|nr:hypothetical protein J6590_046482 [Homalodisca vitripennis]